MEFMILILVSLAGAEIGDIIHELNRFDPSNHLKPKLILAAQPHRRAMQHADQACYSFHTPEWSTHGAYCSSCVHVVITAAVCAIREGVERMYRASAAGRTKSMMWRIGTPPHLATPDPPLMQK